MMRGYLYGPNTVTGGSVAGEIFMLVFGLLVLVGIVILIIWAIRALSGGHQQANTPQQPPMMQHPGMPPQQGMPPQGGAPMRSDGHNEAIAIAKRRLASGEITKEQYDEIMKSLGD